MIQLSVTAMLGFKNLPVMGQSNNCSESKRSSDNQSNNIIYSMCCLTDEENQLMLQNQFVQQGWVSWQPPNTSKTKSSNMLLGGCFLPPPTSSLYLMQSHQIQDRDLKERGEKEQNKSWYKETMECRWASLDLMQNTDLQEWATTNKRNKENKLSCI